MQGCIYLSFKSSNYMQGWEGRCNVVVSVLVSRSSSLGSSPGWGHCVVFLGKTLYSHSASLHPGV